MYHVMNRGVEGNRIYGDASDYECFERYLGKASEDFRLEVCAYVLMSNHYHVVLKTLEANLSQTMHWLQSIYARYYNRKNKRRGHLFQSRYKAIVVESNEYLLWLSGYVHLNPDRAGVVDELFYYRWSSFVDYMLRQPRHGWIKREMVLQEFGMNYDDQRRRYLQWLNEIRGKESKIMDHVRYGIILGSDDFVSWIRQKFGLSDDAELRKIPARWRLEGQDVMKRVLYSVCEEYGIKQEEEVVSDNGRGRIKEARNIAMYILWQYSNIRNEETGKHFGVKSAAVSNNGRRMLKRLRDDLALQLRIERVIKRIMETD